MSTGITRRDALARARLYVVASPEALLDDWRHRIQEALESGAVDVLQLRAKTWSDEQLIATAHDLRRACHATDTLFVLNDRVDLVASVGADGVHVGQDDTPPEDARRVVGPDVLVGVSTHDGPELTAIPMADYAGLGPCFATDSKDLGRVPGGPGLVRDALPQAPAGLAVFPIGGIHAGNLPSLMEAGATRAAVGAGVLAKSDPAAAARTLGALLQSAHAGRA